MKVADLTLNADDEKAFRNLLRLASAKVNELQNTDSTALFHEGVLLKRLKAASGLTH